MLQEPTNGLKHAARWTAISLAGVLAFGTVTVAAQDADTVRPASIHAGTCDSPGDVVAELDPLTVTFDDDDDDGSGTDDADDSATGDDNADDTGTDDDNADDGNALDDLITSDDNADDTGTGDDNADDGATGDDNADDTGTGDDNADDGATGGDDDADDNGDADADDVGTRLTGIQAFQPFGEAGFIGAEDASVVEGSEDSATGTNLEALLAEPHIVAVFESDGSDTIIACGSIGGFVAADDDNDLAIGLRPQNDSGVAGIAILDDDDDNDDLDVDVYIARDVV
ncbi:MAG: hypothetical protein M3439_06040 [Chloroflexota bacterium]|nr:hypothetical protein [Chloroflexota bacterium]